VHKLLYTVLIASRKLRHYFQTHKISMVTSYPLRVVLHNLNVTGNITKWAPELAEFELSFVARQAIKSQVLADFLADWTPPPSHPGGQTAVHQSRQLQHSPALTRPSSSMAPHVSRGPAREAPLLTSDGEQFKYMVHLEFKAINNIA
jgi:hypothetical protein